MAELDLRRADDGVVTLPVSVELDWGPRMAGLELRSEVVRGVVVSGCVSQVMRMGDPAMAELALPRADVGVAPVSKSIEWSWGSRMAGLELRAEVA